MLSLLPSVLLAFTCLVTIIIIPPQLVDSASNNQWKKSIIILAGQSNMSGRGGVTNDTWDGIVPPECRSNPSILRLTKNHTWEEAQEPLHRDIDVKKTCGIGPGMAFANAVLNNKDSSFGVMGLVPCAVGGTNISEWQRGTRLYEKVVKRAKASLVDGGIIRALVWYQGESDTVSYEDAVSYKGNLEKFISDLRADLHSPILPVFQVALASGPGPYIETVREAQFGINLPNVMCVDAKGLPLESDGLHLTTPAQVRLGEMLGDAFSQTSPCSVIPISSNAPSRIPNFISYLIIWPLFRYLLNYNLRLFIDLLDIQFVLVHAKWYEEEMASWLHIFW